MNRHTLAHLRFKAELVYRQARQATARVPGKARIVLALFLVAALLMALHTAFTAKDASLHLKVQHGFRDARISLWVDDDLVFSGRVTGSARKRFGLIPTDLMQGSLSQIIPVRSGQHKVRVKIEPDDAAAQEDSVSGNFASNAERSLFGHGPAQFALAVVARQWRRSSRNVLDLHVVLPLRRFVLPDHRRIDHVRGCWACVAGVAGPAGFELHAQTGVGPAVAALRPRWIEFISLNFQIQRA